MVAPAVTTATIMPSTWLGGEPGGSPKPNTSVARPIAATVPRPMPPTRAPTKIAARTTANSIQIMGSGPLAGPGHRLRIQDLPDLRLGQDLFLPDEFEDPLSGLHRLGGQLGGTVVADHGVERRDDPDAPLEEVPAGVAVRPDALDAELPEGPGPVQEEGLALEDAEGDHRLHDVQLELPGFGRHRHRQVVADDAEADLVHDFRDDGIDLPRHDRGAGLHGRQLDFVEPRAGARGQEAQVVADLGELDRQALEHPGIEDEGLRVLSGLDQVAG